MGPQPTGRSCSARSCHAPSSLGFWQSFRRAWWRWRPARRRITGAARSQSWGREIAKLGHAVRLIPPIYVKPFVKRQKNDAADAEAIAEAASRPTMRFVALKTEEQQARAMIFRARDLLVRQRTQLINAIRGHLTEFGWVAPKGPSHVSVLASLLEEGEEVGASLPEAARMMFLVMTGQLEQLNERVALLDKEIARRAREDEAARRLMTIGLS